ncbi:MAG: SIMPL domain-containing protein [Alistipes sp.]
MKKMILLAVAAFCVLSVAAQQADPYPSYVQVNGRAEKEITPDEFYLSIVINERDSKGKVSVEQQQKAMITSLKGLGVDVEKQLKMANMSSEFFKKNTAVATAKYQLKLGSAAMVYKVTGALSDLGISDVSIQRVTHSQLEQYKQEVRVAAMRNAKECAQTMAAAIGQKITKCFNIIDYNNDMTPVMYDNAVFARSMKSNADSESSSDEPLDFKTMKLSASVQARFVLE